MSSSTDSSSEILINIKGPNELKIQVNITTDKTVMDLKRAIAEKSDVEADRQRLIYSGKVLKDEDVLSQYKIQASHTIHMVKGAARNHASTSSSTPQVLPTMQAGQNPSDPLTVLNGPMGHGLMAGFNPFAGLGVNPNDPNMMQGMLESPQFLQQMSSLMSNPAILDQVIASNPQLQEMGPQIRQIFQSEQFRQIMSNPESMRNMLQMSAMLRDSGLGGGNGGGAPRGPGLFGAAAAAAQQANNTGSPATTTPFNPSAWPPFPPAAGQAGNAGTGITGQQGSTTPGMLDLALLQQLLGAGGGGFPGLGGFGAPAPTPADTRPPEERFQVQLGQLQDMGFTNASQNIRALLATGGNVHSAIEYILSGGGI
ncbi:hypothetical protein Clacol_007834 [Clathrus columnatus]|uniref:Ubiquilin n=1 Tax=Clathrus columnatus TaxID=1419009 RepID=A0AAV5AJ82_9AGAM|nr:hypothetical protein Clacol_007834 [Clathrus columnatus]